MVKARIVLVAIIIVAILGGVIAFTAYRGLSNLFMTTTGHFTQNDEGLWLTYATLSPYRTFRISNTQTTVNAMRPLYTTTTITWTVIGGEPYFYPVVSGTVWPSTLVYADEGQ